MNLNQQSQIDLNFNRKALFTLPVEGRPVFVNSTSIFPATGAILSRDAFDAPARTHVADGGTDETNRIDAGVTVEPPILDRDDRVLKVGRDVGQQHIVALLVEAEPLPAVGAVEHRVADAAREPVDDDGVARQPHGRQRPEDDQRAEQYGRGPLGPAAGAQ